MLRTKKKSDFVSYDYERFDIAIRESRNLARWNPSLAIHNMQKASTTISSDLQEKLYNTAVDHINSTIKSIMGKHYYDNDLYWGDNQVVYLNKEYNFE